MSEKELYAVKLEKKEIQLSLEAKAKKVQEYEL